MESPFVASILLALAAGPAVAQGAPQKFLSPAPGLAGRFGASVALDLDRALVGAPGEDSSAGAAYVFDRVNGVWAFAATLTPIGSAANDQFGHAVALADDVAVVGARHDDEPLTQQGSASVFVRTGSGWSQVQELVAPDGAAFDRFGSSVSIEGDWIAVGAPGRDGGQNDSGAVYLYLWLGGVAAHFATLLPPQPVASGAFGASVRLRGSSLIVGSTGDNERGPLAGAAFVYDLVGSSWQLGQKLLGDDQTAFDFAGNSVALDCDTAVVGAHGANAVAPDSGAAYVFRRSAGTWVQAAKLVATDGANSDWLGYSVALSSGRILLGAPLDDLGVANVGSAYLFREIAGQWQADEKFVAPDGQALDQFGISVALLGADALVGVDLDDDGAAAAGSAWAIPIPPPGPLLQVRVSVKNVLGPGGQPNPHWSAANIEAWFQGASALLRAQSNVELVFETVPLPDPGWPVPWFNLDVQQMEALEIAAESQPCAFAWRPDAINVYLVNSRFAGAQSVEGVASFPTDGPTENDLVVLAPSSTDPIVLIAHELGHYFGLRHTHAKFEKEAGGCAAGPAGDCVCDTPDDADPDGIGCAAHLAALEALEYSKQDFHAVRYNVMSYHCGVTAANAVLTPGQTQRLREMADTWRRHVTIGQIVPTLASASPAAVSYPSATHLTLNGANLPTTGLIEITAHNQVSGPATSTGTSVSAAFAAPLVPGAYCVGLRQNGQLVAALPQGLHVLPSLEAHITPPWKLAITVRVPTPNAPVVLALAAPSLLPLQIPGILYELLLDAASLTPVTLTSSSAGVVPLEIPVGPAWSGNVLAMQTLQVLPVFALTNLSVVIVP